MSAVARDRADVLDLRLAVPAGAAWLVAWRARLLPVGWVVAAALLASTVAVVLLAVRRRGPHALLAAVLACAAAAGIATAARVHARTSGPLAAAARSSSSVVLEGALVDDPHQVARKADVLSFRPLVVFRLRAQQLTVAGRRTALRAPVLVLSADTSWLGALPGTRVRVDGRLRAAGRGDDVAALLSARGPPRLLSRASLVQRVAGHLRAGLRTAVAPLPAAERGLLPGLVEGDTSGLDPGLAEDFRTVGLTHVVAVSGTNVAVVLAAALVACGWLRIGLRWRPPVAALVLACFVVLARPSPSVLRAAVMGLVALLALASGSRRQAVPALSGAVLVLVLLSPELAASPGFALSVLASGGLLLFGPPWRAHLAAWLPRWVPGWLPDAIAVPAAAQAACGPVIVAISGQLGLLSVPANLLVAPAVGPATVLGVLVALVTPVSLPAAQALGWLAYLPTHWLVVVAQYGARQPGATVGWPSGERGAWLLVAATGAVMLVLSRPALRRVAVAGTAGLLVAATVVIAVRPAWPPPGWVIVSCDVGQGDGHVVRLGPGTALVVDTGPDPAPIDRCLRRLGVHRVPLLVLTHLHADHVEGVPGLLHGRKVGQVEIGPLDEPAVERDRLLRWTRDRGVPVVRASIGETRSAGGVSWQVLDATARHGTDSDPNNSSVVLRLTTGGVTALFAGDLESDAQQSLLDRGLDLRADVLKVPHHGSSKQDPAFLDAVGERVALTPVGAGNPYGHPAAATLSRIERDGARTYRSDRDGDVAIVVRDGRLLSVGRRGNGVAAATVEGRAVAGAQPSLPLRGLPVVLAAASLHAPDSLSPQLTTATRAAAAATSASAASATPVLGLPSSALDRCDDPPVPAMGVRRDAAGPSRVTSARAPPRPGRPSSSAGRPGAGAGAGPRAGGRIEP